MQSHSKTLFEVKICLTAVILMVLPVSLKKYDQNVLFMLQSKVQRHVDPVESAETRLHQMESVR